MDDEQATSRNWRVDDGEDGNDSCSSMDPENPREVDESESDDDDHDPDYVLPSNTNASSSEFSGLSDSYIELPEHVRDLGASFMRGWEPGGRHTVPLPFTGKTGIRELADLPPPEEARPIDYFHLFMDEGHFEIMAQQTNLYARQTLAKEQLSASSRSHNWKETNKAEMELFMALLIDMGLLVAKDVASYWSKEDALATPFFPSQMPRDRFWLLLKFFHLSDNTFYVKKGQPGFSPLKKMGHVYQSIIHRFQSVYYPSQFLSIDEGMVPWRGNLGFRVYMPAKPKKYGMKVYMLCDSTNAYVCQFKLYTGYSDIPVSEGGITFDLVSEMMEHYCDRGHHLFMDNYYSSPLLYKSLWEMGVGATGTLRVNRRGIPQAIKDRKLKKGEKMVMRNKNLLLVKYEDRKTVYMQSTVENTTEIKTGKVTHDGIEVKKMRMVHKYNKYMGGVDRADQMLSYTPVKAKTVKWWKRLMFHVLNVCVLNAYLVYKVHQEGRKLMKHSEFRVQLVNDIVRKTDKRKLPCPPTFGRRRRRSQHAQPLGRLDGLLHIVGKVKVPENSKKKNISRSCVVCCPAEREYYKTHERPTGRRRFGRESTYECATCSVTMCMEPCFGIYHTTVNYKKKYLQMKFEGEKLDSCREDGEDDENNVDADDDGDVGAAAAGYDADHGDGLNRAEWDDAGRDDAGQDDVGRDDAGQDDVERDDAGRDDAGKDVAGGEDMDQSHGDDVDAILDAALRDIDASRQGIDASSRQGINADILQTVDDIMAAPSDAISCTDTSSDSADSSSEKKDTSESEVNCVLVFCDGKNGHDQPRQQAEVYTHLRRSQLRRPRRLRPRRSTV